MAKLTGRDSDNEQAFTRRALMLGIGGAGIFTALTSRLYYLQVIKAEDYRLLSDSNRFNFRTVVPSRGRILDRNGEALASNRQDYSVVLIPERIRDIDATLTRMKRHISLSEKTLDRIKRDIRQKRKFTPVLIEDHLSWDVFAAINLDLPDLPGVVPISGETRSYPKSGAFSHLTGYVGTPNPSDLEVDPDTLLRQPSFQMGKIGVERAADKRLRGQAGRLKVEVNALGRTVREWPDANDAAIAGDDVYLTIDAGLQAHTAKLYEEDSGGAALIDVSTGELRSLLSMPLYDANLFVSGLTQADVNALNNDPRRPQFNKVLGGAYPPASTFKMVIAMAGLETGHINPTEKILCTGKVNVGNRDFHCWKRRGGHRAQNLLEALQHSCDIYFYEVGQRIGMDAIKSMGERLGLGQSYDLGVGGQVSGTLPNNAWKQARLGDSWRTGDTLNASIGQGFVQTTPLQLAVMAARLASGTKAVSPFVMIGENAPQFAALDVNPEHLTLVQEAMFAVCEVPGGTGYRPGGMGIAGAQMAGKTGTGQVRGISTAERASGVLSNRDLPWKYRDHSIFVGYAPYDKPRFAASCIVEHGGSGAGRAADIVRSMLGYALRSDGYDEAAARQVRAIDL